MKPGVRFNEVSHNLDFINGTDWDTHNEGQQNQHLHIKEPDVALSALNTNLEKPGILDRTLIAIGNGFGRAAVYEGRGGVTVTDELIRKVVENPDPVPDFHATIHAALASIRPRNFLTSTGHLDQRAVYVNPMRSTNKKRQTAKRRRMLMIAAVGASGHGTTQSSFGRISHDTGSRHNASTSFLIASGSVCQTLMMFHKPGSIPAMR